MAQISVLRDRPGRATTTHASEESPFPRHRNTRSTHRVVILYASMRNPRIIAMIPLLGTGLFSSPYAAHDSTVEAERGAAQSL